MTTTTTTSKMKLTMNASDQQQRSQPWEIYTVAEWSAFHDELVDIYAEQKAELDRLEQRERDLPKLIEEARADRDRQAMQDLRFEQQYIDEDIHKQLVVVLDALFDVTRASAAARQRYQHEMDDELAKARDVVEQATVKLKQVEAKYKQRKDAADSASSHHRRAYSAYKMAAGHRFPNPITSPTLEVQRLVRPLGNTLIEEA